jgi:cyclic pyranopterin monophosphate synthase
MAESSRMVGVGGKPETEREAVAEATITMSAQACKQLLEGTPKGNPLEAARIAGLQAVKKTPELLPFCHPVRVVGAECRIQPGDGSFRVEMSVRALDRTGVEMEALTGASVAALSLYDTAKAFDRAAVISGVRLLSKTGGKGGDYRA